MWIPKTEDEIVRVVTSGSLEESAIFDAKKELPGKNLETAKDVAAMANDGGVLVYGIGEDEHGRPKILNPIPLKGQPERITAIVQTSIAEPPRIVISTIPTAADPSVGYLVVVVSASERSPHMVVARQDNRYYGRTATGNTPLNEAEVARLYERRHQWEVDREVLLAQEIERAPLPPRPGFAYLHLIAQPVLRRAEFLDSVVRDGQTIQGILHESVALVQDPSVFPRIYAPDFDVPSQWIHRTEGFLGRLCFPSRVDDPRAPAYALELQIDFDGSGHLFCGRAAEHKDGVFWFFPSIVIGNTIRFLTFLGGIYARATYVAMVDIGVAITGMRGTIPFSKDFSRRVSFAPYDRDEYRRTNRVSAITLEEDPHGIAKKLLMPLFNAIFQGRVDPSLVKYLSSSQ